MARGAAPELEGEGAEVVVAVKKGIQKSSF